MTTPIHQGMPCDPLTVEGDERVPEVAGGQRVWCHSCPTVMLGVGILEHNADGSHSWTPTRTLPRWAGWIPVLVVLVVVAAAVAWKVAGHG